MRCENITLSGVKVVLDPMGVLFLPDQATLVVSDLHLEKGSSFARSRQFLPPYDTGETLARLARCIRRHKPSRVVALGDSFHDMGGPGRLGESDHALLGSLVRTHEWVWITGNHDPEPPPGLSGISLPEFELSGLVLRHEPQKGAEGEIAGHLHPTATISGRAGSLRRQAFLTNGSRLIMPAFGAYTGGLNALDRAFEVAFPDGGFVAWALGERRIHPVRSQALR